jgi:hypothetical protein
VKVCDAVPLQSKSRSHTADLVGTGTIEHNFLICDGWQQGIQILEGDRERSGNAALLPFDFQSKIHYYQRLARFHPPFEFACCNATRPVDAV